MSYRSFVQSVTSKESAHPHVLAVRVEELCALIHSEPPDPPLNYAALLTGAVGLVAEAGELLDIVKKLTFHGDNYTPEMRAKMIKELGDVRWYFEQCLIGLDTTMAVVEQGNVDKLSARHSTGSFKTGYKSDSVVQVCVSCTHDFTDHGDDGICNWCGVFCPTNIKPSTV